ncbi:MAG: hypothetical protein J0L75_21575 [Spirochaetes bacterium]|nr:hypothetical protein [Spirochaetota bacterium]
MNSLRSALFALLAPCAVFAEAPRLFVAPFSMAKGSSPADLSLMTSQFRAAIRREGRFRVVEPQAVKAKTGLYGAMSEVGAKEAGDCAGLPCQLSNALGLGAEKAAIGTLTRRAGALQISLSYVDVKTGKVEATFREKAAPATDPLLHQFEKLAIALESRLPPTPRVKAGWPVFEVKPVPLKPVGLAVGIAGLGAVATSVVVELVASYSPLGAYNQYVSYVPPTSADQWQVALRYRNYTDTLSATAATRVVGIVATGVGSALFIAGILTRKAAAKKASRSGFGAPGETGFASQWVLYPLLDPQCLGLGLAAEF